MSNYKETQIDGTQWRRAHRIVIDNPVDGSPRITFLEQTASLMNDGQIISQPAGHIQKDFDPAGTITLINPMDGQPLGQTITQLELQVILYSLYLQLAVERDTPPPSNGV